MLSAHPALAHRDDMDLDDKENASSSGTASFGTAGFVKASTAPPPTLPPLTTTANVRSPRRKTRTRAGTQNATSPHISARLAAQRAGLLPITASSSSRPETESIVDKLARAAAQSRANVIHVPRKLVRPKVPMVQREVLQAIDPALKDIPIPYIQAKLNGMRDVLVQGLASVTAHTLPTTPGLPLELPIKITNRKAYLPTHIFAAIDSKTSKVELFPIHSLLFATQCANLPVFTSALKSKSKSTSSTDTDTDAETDGTLRETPSPDFAGERPAPMEASEHDHATPGSDMYDSSFEGAPALSDSPPSSPTSPSSSSILSLPVIPFVLPHPSSFPLLHQYLYSHSLTSLISALIPLPPRSFPPVDPTSPANTLNRLANALAVTFTLSALLDEAKLVYGVWSNVCKLGIRDEDLWKCVESAWDVVVKAIGIASGQEKPAETL